MTLTAKVLAYSSLLALLAGCSSLSPKPTAKRAPDQPASTGGGYYKDDGPGVTPPADLAAIPDAVPKPEAAHRFANRPYRAMGRDYTPIPAEAGYRASGLASWYGRRFHGKPTASGEPYDMYAMTAAHPTLPIPSYARVVNPRNGRAVIVRINDRGPFHEDRLIDLSYTAAWKLDLLGGVGTVEVEKLDPATPTAVLTTAVPPATPVLASGIYLQLAALANPASVDELLRRVRASTLRPPGLHRIDGGTLVRVQAGPYPAAAAADEAAQEFERELGLKPYRVVR